MSHLTEPGLTEPGRAQHASFLAALGEYHAEGLHDDLDADVLADPAVFDRWLRAQQDAGRAGTAPLARDRVPHRELWWVQGAEHLGRVRLNLALNDQLWHFGGHIGYDVRPTARGRGHATAMLAAALDLAARHGIDAALLTCAPDNTASRRVIERNGGRLQDLSDAGRLRFWCPTTPAGRWWRMPDRAVLPRRQDPADSGAVDAVEIRRARDGELAAVAALRWQWVIADGGGPVVGEEVFAVAFEQWARAHTDSHRCTVAVRGDRVVGMAWLALVDRVPSPHSLERTTADVQCVYVVPEERGGGVGRRLVGAAVALAHQWGVERVTVHSSDRAVPLYRRAGFTSHERLLDLDVTAPPSR